MKILITFLMILGVSSVLAQQYPSQLRSTSFGKVKGIIAISDGALQVTGSSFSQETGSRIEGASISLHNASLVINYRLQPINANEEYRLKLEVNTERNGQLTIPPEYFRGILEGIKPKKEEVLQIVWTDFVEQVFNPLGNIEVNLQAELWGSYSPIDCSQPPVFTSREKRPYLIAAGAGLAMIGTGVIIKQQSNDIYDNDYLPEPMQEAAQPLYDDANGKHHTFVILTYAGLTVLAADAVMYLLRASKHKQELKLYQQFCSGNSLSLRPHFEVAPSHQNYTGLRLSYNF